MRAFMSSGREEALANGVAGGFAALAEREARAILAETEPDGKHVMLAYLAAARQYRMTFPHESTGPIPAACALADALRAFVEE